MVKAKCDLEQRLEKLHEHAKAIAATGATHNELWNAVFGIGARYGQLFATREDREAADKLPAMKSIRNLVKAAPTAEPAANDKTGRLSVRLPKSLHVALADEADAEGCSLNQLILAKLSVTLGQAVSR